MIGITLTKREMAMAAECGAARNIAAMAAGKADAHGFACEEGGWGAHIEGACGEIAAANALGLAWVPTVNTWHDPDLPPDIQVRTRSRHHYDLLVRRRDPLLHRYVLVTGRAPHFVVRGWLRSSLNVRRPEWLRDYGGRTRAWFVPQAVLLDMQEMAA